MLIFCARGNMFKSNKAAGCEDTQAVQQTIYHTHFNQLILSVKAAWLRVGAIILSAFPYKDSSIIGAIGAHQAGLPVLDVSSWGGV
jgi:hypothetical protein